MSHSVKIASLRNAIVKMGAEGVLPPPPEMLGIQKQEKKDNLLFSALSDLKTLRRH